MCNRPFLRDKNKKNERCTGKTDSNISLLMLNARLCSSRATVSPSVSPLCVCIPAADDLTHCVSSSGFLGFRAHICLIWSSTLKSVARQRALKMCVKNRRVRFLTAPRCAPGTEESYENKTGRRRREGGEGEEGGEEEKDDLTWHSLLSSWPQVPYHGRAHGQRGPLTHVIITRRVRLIRPVSARRSD